MSQTGPPPPDRPDPSPPEPQPPAAPAGWTPAPPPPAAPAGWGPNAPAAAPPVWGQGGAAPPPGGGAYGWGGPPPAPKPGSIPLRPLGVGDILEGTFAILRRYPGATLGSSAVVAGVVGLLQLALLVPVLGVVDDVVVAAESGDPDAVVDRFLDVSWGAVVAGGLALALLSFGLYVLLAGILATVVGQAAVGARLSFTQAWRRALPRLGRLLAASVLVILLVGSIWFATAVLWVLAVAIDAGIVYALVALASFVAVPVTVYVGIRVALTTPAVALESTAAGPIGPVAGIRRAWSLIRGAWWRTFGVLLLAAVIAGALSQVIAIPLGIIVSFAPLDAQVAIAVGTLTAAIGQAVAVPVSGLVLALVYVDRRIRTEQLDVSLAQAAGVELAPAPPPWPPQQPPAAGPPPAQPPAPPPGQGTAQ